MAFLPPSIAIFRDEHLSHLRYVQESGDLKGLLRIDDTPLYSPFVKMDVELAQTGEGLVHLRCVYNNRYWRRSSPTDWWLAAESREPEDDQSNWSCTLFKPERVGIDEIRFRHMNTGRYAGMWKDESPFTNCLYVGPVGTEISAFNFVDYDQLLFLPKYVAFKKDGKFLRPSSASLAFTADDFADLAASHEITTTRDGLMLVKNDASSPPSFWYLLLGIVSLFALGGNSFRPFTADKNPATNHQFIAIAYRNNFCRVKPADEQYKSPRFVPDLPRITNEAKMEVVERVFSRQIYNVQFRQMDGRIYNEQIIDAGHQEIINKGSEPVDATLTFTYTHTTSKRWEHNVYASVGVETTITTKIPFLAEGEISTSAEAGYEHTWGTEESSSTEKSTSTVWVVPPMKKHIVRLLVTVASFDVPFSYTQRDKLTTGHYAIQVRHDGVFKGVNTTIFKYEAEEEDI